MARLNFRDGRCFLDDQPFYIASGDIHYFRIYPGGLERRLKYMKAFGLTTVQTYVPWNLHEPEKGKFNFEGLADLEGFLKLIVKYDLKCLLRPSPYICSEWDKGGLPYWLSKERLPLRCSDQRFLAHIDDYYKVLCEKFVPYLSTNGGPIIAVAVENEYGSFGNDEKYLLALADMLVKYGVDVPLYTADGHEAKMLKYGPLDNVWAGVDYRLESKRAITALNKRQPSMPPLIAEYWSGRAIHWGEGYFKRNVAEVADAYQQALINDGLVNFYMFAGGTNFGFMNGANYGVSFGKGGTPIKYIQISTSYDCDALLNEQGIPTPKYFECRKKLFQYLNKPEPPMPEIDYKTQIPNSVKIEKRADLFDNLDLFDSQKSVLPLCFEDMNQDYGFCLYRTVVSGCGGKCTLKIPHPRDRVDVFVNNKFLGSVMRGRENSPIVIDCEKDKHYKIELLVENCGRINFGQRIDELKGLPNGVFLDYVRLHNWENISIPFSSLSGFNYKAIDKKDGPALYKATFKAEVGIDTFIDMSSFCKGFVFVNGYNLGRYWNIGPQYSLYIPGELLKSVNQVEIFEQYSIPQDLTVSFTDHQLLTQK